MVPGWSGFLGNRLRQGAVPRGLLTGVLLLTVDHKEHLINPNNLHNYQTTLCKPLCIGYSEQLCVKLSPFLSTYWGYRTTSCKPTIFISTQNSEQLCVNLLCICKFKKQKEKKYHPNNNGDWSESLQRIAISVPYK